jgi:hypothetical protein
MVNGAGAAETLGQRLPLATGAQHIDHGRENLARRDGFAPAARPPPILASAFRSGKARWQERFDPRPQGIGDFPRLSFRHAEIMAETKKQVNAIYG